MGLYPVFDLADTFIKNAYLIFIFIFNLGRLSTEIFTCLRHLIRSKAVVNRIFFSENTYILSYIYSELPLI